MNNLWEFDRIFLVEFYKQELMNLQHQMVFLTQPFHITSILLPIYHTFNYTFIIEFVMETYNMVYQLLIVRIQNINPFIYLSQNRPI